MGQYEDAVGRDGNLVQGKASKTETYRSMAEVVRDMGNPLYDRDESYRDDATMVAEFGKNWKTITDTAKKKQAALDKASGKTK